MQFRFSARRSAALVCVVSAVVPALAQPSVADIVRGVRFRNIGPAVMSGRVADIEVDPKNRWIVYVATASGGVWKSTSGGVTWAPIFDDQDSASIGDVEVSEADSNVVWVGAGEHSNRNSVAYGYGVYKSTDGGRTWANMGLRETQQIARIITHPKDANIAWVAVIGPLWNASQERGLYMTTDGGKTWNKTLYVDENTGACDLVIDPKNPRNLFVGMYERRRYPWTFRSGGAKGGVFRSGDGGLTWKRVEGGLPTGLTGKIGLTVFNKDPKIMYAMIEAERGATPAEDKNGIYRSADAGKTWKRMGTHGSRPFYYHEIMVDSEDPNRIYSLSTNMMLSVDGGATWRSTGNQLHVDYHAIWIDPADTNYLWCGSDGATAVSYDRGATWRWCPLPVGQFYALGVDMAVPYRVFGGLQDNGSWGGPSASRSRRGIGNYDWFNVGGGDGFHVQVDYLDNETIYSESQGGAISRRNIRTGEQRSIRPRPAEGQRFRFNWSSPIVMSPHNPRIIWFGGNFLFKSVDRGDNWRTVSPDLTTNDPEKLKPMAGLTPETTGAENHCTIITISESPVKPDVVWVGTDDGLVQVTTNGGVNWENVTSNILGVPSNTWVSRVTASKFKLERCYATFDGHRTGDMKSYVMTSEDMGKTWTSIKANLPDEPVYVIKEDPINQNLLYLGTEFGLYVSLDRGASWTRWRTNLPTVAIHDLVIHPREREIVLATHGRAFWIAPVEGLQQLNEAGMAASLMLADTVDAWAFVNDTTGGYGDGQGWFWGENPPAGARIQYYLKDDVADVKVEILSVSGDVIATLGNPPKTKGLNVVYWNLRPSQPGGGPGGGGPGGGGGGRGGGQGGGGFGQAMTGSFAVRVTTTTETATKRLIVRPDPKVGQ